MAWVPRPATSTTTAASISTSPISDPTSCFATTATGRSPTGRAPAGSTIRRGASRRRFSITTATAGSISTSATTSSGTSRPTSRAPASPAAATTARRRSTCQRPIACITNRGNGTFEDVTAKSLLGGPFGPALGVASADFDGDGWIDIYVANDGTENLLWMNQRNGTFRNTGLLAGSALSADGKPEASMGVDAGRLRQRRRRRPLHDPSPGRGQQSVREPTAPPCSRTSARHRGSDRSASGTAASAPPGSTTTTTAGWICSPSTARSRPSRGGRPTRGSRTTNASSCSATCATAASRTSPRRPARSSLRLK